MAPQTASFVNGSTNVVITSVVRRASREPVRPAASDRMAGRVASAARRVNRPLIRCRYSRSAGGFMLSSPPSGDCISAPVSGQRRSRPDSVTPAMPNEAVSDSARRTSERRRSTSIGSPPAGRSAKSPAAPARSTGGGLPSGSAAKVRTGVAVVVTVPGPPFDEG